jgi:glutathione S-transferase
MDSTKIAQYLEEKYPEPSLHLDSDYIARLLEVLPPVQKASFACFLTGVPNTLLNEGSLDYWYTTRREWVGMDINQYAAENGGEAVWKVMAPLLAPITALVNENEGPYFLGKEAGQADFIWAGFLLFFKSLGYLNELLAVSGDAQAHFNLLEAIKPLTERNGL